jgi:uncharacterized protein YlbG (UPF0298 family)
MFFSCEFRVLSVRGLCDELITHTAESYRLRCTVVCDLETLKNERDMARVGSLRHIRRGRRSLIIYCIVKVLYGIWIKCNNHKNIPNQHNSGQIVQENLVQR